MAERVAWYGCHESHCICVVWNRRLLLALDAGLRPPQLVVYSLCISTDLYFCPDNMQTKDLCLYSALMSLDNAWVINPPICSESSSRLTTLAARLTLPAGP